MFTLTSYKKGIWAEYAVCVYLMLRGYRVLKLRYKTKLGEVDIVACKGKCLHFIEVKYRKKIMDAAESITPKARARIARSAQIYSAAYPKKHDYAMSFDVVLIAPPFFMKHLDNAWSVYT